MSHLARLQRLAEAGDTEALDILLTRSARENDPEKIAKYLRVAHSAGMLENARRALWLFVQSSPTTHWWAAPPGASYHSWKVSYFKDTAGSTLMEPFSDLKLELLWDTQRARRVLVHVIRQTLRALKSLEGRPRANKRGRLTGGVWGGLYPEGLSLLEEAIQGGLLLIQGTETTRAFRSLRRKFQKVGGRDVTWCDRDNIRPLMPITMFPLYPLAAGLVGTEPSNGCTLIVERYTSRDLRTPYAFEFFREDRVRALLAHLTGQEGILDG